MDIQKPPHGSPCNGCGLCCKEELCPLAAALFAPFGLFTCPLLVAKPEGGYGCGLVIDPERFTTATGDEAKALGEAAAILIGAGIGCDAQLVGEPRGKGFDAVLRKRRKEMKPAAAKARELWGV